MKHLMLLLAMLVSVFTLSAKDDSEKVPSGFFSLEELAEAKAKAIKDQKLLVLVVKGRDDDCPNCAAAFDNGMSAVGSGVVKVFTRPDIIQKADQGEFSEALKTRTKQTFTSGAAVTIMVFPPEMDQIVAEGTRKELQSNKDSIRAFKDQVKEAKKALK
jgi:hypothetical protein